MISESQYYRSSKSPQERSAILLKVAEILESRLEEFAQLESADQGKTLTTARTVDIPRAVKNFRFFATAILHHEDTSCVTEGDARALNYTLRQPVGVAGLISPWNLPLYLLTWKIAPCIAVGNTCVCKPSELTSATAHRLGEVLQAAGVPPGVVNLVLGTGPSVGAALVSHPRVPLISFTGGTRTGEVVQRLAAPLCKKLSLELGGKNASLVFSDVGADEALLEECVACSVRAAFANQGEICLCASRILVQRPLYERFAARLVEQARAWRAGPPGDPASRMGALVSREHLDKVRSFVELARREGGQILCGGGAPTDLPEANRGGYFLEATVIAGLPPSSPCLQEEIFGPVATLTPFDSEEEAIAIANGVRYGLAACVWSLDVRRAHRVAARLQAGTVWVNCWMLRDLRVPFGGTKLSGFGREGGQYSIDFFTDHKTVCVKLA